MKLLLAEDEIQLSKALTAILKANNYTVDAVYDGKSAIDYITTQSYDGIILDVMMPEADGFTVLREIRKAGISTPVLMLTAMSSVEDRINGLDLGADDYLSKPFVMGELLARVRALTRRTGGVTPNTIAMGNITLDRSSYTISCGEKTAELTGKEFQIMELLMNAKGRCISTEQFLSSVWSCESTADISVVWVYISYIRKKLEGIGANVEIKAKRGRGYTLEEIS